MNLSQLTRTGSMSSASAKSTRTGSTEASSLTSRKRTPAIDSPESKSGPTITRKTLGTNLAPPSRRTDEGDIEVKIFSDKPRESQLQGPSHGTTRRLSPKNRKKDTPPLGSSHHRSRHSLRGRGGQRPPLSTTLSDDDLSIATSSMSIATASTCAKEIEFHNLYLAHRGSTRSIGTAGSKGRGGGPPRRYSRQFSGKDLDTSRRARPSMLRYDSALSRSTTWSAATPPGLYRQATPPNVVRRIPGRRTDSFRSTGTSRSISPVRGVAAPIRPACMRPTNPLAQQLRQQISELSLGAGLSTDGSSRSLLTNASICQEFTTEPQLKRKVNVHADGIPFEFEWDQSEISLWQPAGNSFTPHCVHSWDQLSTQSE